MVRVPFAAVAALALLAPAPADAISLGLTHPYGELIDSGPVTAHYAASPPDRVDCTVPPVVTRQGNSVTIDVRRVPPGATSPICLVPDEVAIGELSAGWWTIQLRVLDSTGAGAVEGYVSTWRIGKPETLCNRYPSSRAAVIVDHRMHDGRQLADRIAHDPAFAARMGHPSEVQPLMHVGGAILYYGWLDNPPDLRARLIATGEFASVHADGQACFAAPPPDRFGDVVEYFHAGLSHYFYASDPAEIAALDDGTGARGWARTGESFRVLVAPGCPLSRREQAAYRFFGKPGVGPSSHVFTVDRAECRIVHDGGAWQFEGSPFWATPPGARGGCDDGEIPLYRVWKPFGESNHRFTTDRSIVAAMTFAGWIDEGVAMCVRG